MRRPLRPLSVLFSLLLLSWSLVMTGQAMRRPVVLASIQPVPTEFRIDINAAQVPTLQLLPGIGPSIARNIVQYRQEHGPFTEPAELERVRQIGPARRNEIMPWVEFPTPPR